MPTHKVQQRELVTIPVLGRKEWCTHGVYWPGIRVDSELQEEMGVHTAFIGQPLESTVSFRKMPQWVKVSPIEPENLERDPHGRSRESILTCCPPTHTHREKKQMTWSLRYPNFPILSVGMIAFVPMTSSNVVLKI